MNGIALSKEPAPLQFSLNESRKNGNKKEKRERWGETVKEKIVRGETSGESKIVGRKVGILVFKHAVLRNKKL